MFERFMKWRKKRNLRSPVVLRFTFPAPADDPGEGTLEIEIFLGWLLPGSIASKFDAWMKDLDEFRSETARGRRRGRSV